MAGKYWDYSPAKAAGGTHTDDDGNPCDCMSQECNRQGNCPQCGSDDFDLVCGDHGCRCNKCKATFCCP